MITECALGSSQLNLLGDGIQCSKVAVMLELTSGVSR